MDKLFNIFKPGAAEAKRIAATPEEPHNHDFEELIAGMSGEIQLVKQS